MDNLDWFDESKFVPTPDDRLPAADIDDLFIQAFDNPGYRAELMRRLPDTYLWILVRNEPELEDKVGEYGFMAPLHLEDGRLPMFTAEMRVHEAQAIPPDIRWAYVQAGGLLSQLNDVDVVINPFSEKQLTLNANGIAQMLVGNYEEPDLTRTQVQPPQSGQALISTDKELAEELLEALRVVFSRYPRVQEAYMTYLLADDAPDSINRYHLRLEIEGEPGQQLMQEIGPVLRVFMQRDEGLELWAGLDNDELSDHLRRQGPFYERT